MSSMVSALSALNSTFANASVNTGEVWRPADGVYPVMVEDLIMVPSKRGFMATDAQKEGSPALDLTFRYRLLEDPEAAAQKQPPRAFIGLSFTLPTPTPAQMDKKKAEGLERDLGRLKGICSAVLGTAASENDLTGNLNQIVQKLADSKAGGPAVTLKVRLARSTYKNKDGKDVTMCRDFGAESLSA